MNILSSFLVAVGLSMDNLAVTVSAGCARSHHSCMRLILQIGLLFALAHFIMFAIGFEGGVLLHASQVLGAWVACMILVIIGVRMIKEALSPHEETACPIFTSLKTQLALAVATSLDALFVGAGMSLAGAAFWQTQFFLVLCVFITSCCGFYLGNYLGKKFGRNMEIAGGTVLILLGVKVLLEGVGIW